MKSMQEVMDEKQFFAKENGHWLVSGYIHLIPSVRTSDVMIEVDSCFTEVSIVDKRSGNSIYIPEHDDWGLRDLLWEFRCRAVEAKHNEWWKAVRENTKYDLFASYQNAIAEYLQATGANDE